jgi:hypothetical protein
MIKLAFIYYSRRLRLAHTNRRRRCVAGLAGMAWIFEFHCSKITSFPQLPQLRMKACQQSFSGPHDVPATTWITASDRNHNQPHPLLHTAAMAVQCTLTRHTQTFEMIRCVELHATPAVRWSLCRHIAKTEMRKDHMTIVARPQPIAEPCSRVWHQLSSQR